MDRIRRTIIALALGILLTAQIGWQAAPSQLDPAGVKKMLDELGYEAKEVSKEPGKETFQVSLTREKFNIPITFEVSPSKSYIWLTVTLRESKDEADFSASEYRAMLVANSVIQPCQLYLSAKGSLRMGLPLENRAITVGLIRKSTEKIADDVVKTAPQWQKKK